MDDTLISVIFGTILGAWLMFLGTEIYECCTSKQECKKVDNVTICRDVYTHITKSPYIVENTYSKEVEW